MPNDLSVWTMVLDASPIVQAVVFLLLAASIASWAIIFRKSRVISHSRRQADKFETEFWSGGDLATLYRSIETKGRAGTGLQSIFESGFGEFSRLRQLGTPADQLLEGSRRAMRVAQMREMDRLERNLAMLATVGSTSPYVGLFGTVWGIMSAFHNLGNVQQATLAAVAPGIAEALVTTAIGLFAAIPAVIAYNRFADQVSRLELRFDTFVEEFSTILQRTGRRGRRPEIHARTTASSQIDGSDQRRALHRRDAGAAHHFHDHRTAAQGRYQSRFAERGRTPDRPRIFAEARALDRDHRCAWTPLRQLRAEPRQTRDGSDGERSYRGTPAPRSANPRA